MSKRTEISTAMKESMKNKDQVALSTIRLITSAMKDRDIAAREQGVTDGIGDGEILLLLQSMIKQRAESAKTYKDAGRLDLSEREDQEIAIIRQFLPQQMDQSQIEAAISEVMSSIGASGIRDMGKLMAVMREKYAGQVDMAIVGEIAKKKLA